MNSSTYEVSKRLLTTTNAHVESDQSGEIEEKWGDSSVNYKAYVNYDEVEVPIIDSSIIEKLKEQERSMRHTHLYLEPDINDSLMQMNEYYMEHKLGAYEFPINSSGGIYNNMQPIPDEFINNLDFDNNENNTGDK